MGTAHVLFEADCEVDCDVTGSCITGSDRVGMHDRKRRHRKSWTGNGNEREVISRVFLPVFPTISPGTPLDSRYEQWNSIELSPYTTKVSFTNYSFCFCFCYIFLELSLIIRIVFVFVIFFLELSLNIRFVFCFCYIFSWTFSFFLINVGIIPHPRSYFNIMF
jgi:hypothetical protein